ncbi:MAG: adenosine kinase [Pseudomonadota bacterium]|nr:adenosine kinase [Pseudomonadota bacterium]
MALDLYAIGNALVDREYSVDDALLANCNLTKGTMQLANATQQAELMATLNQYTAPTGQVSGGSAANTAFAFAALGGSAFYACRVGNDDAGDFYLADLTSAGVQTSAISQELGQTGTCLVMVTADGERTMHTHLGITADLSPEQVDLAPLKDARFLYIEGYLSSSDSARQAVAVVRELARSQGSQIAMSLSDPAMVQYAYDGLIEMLGTGVDVLFCNEMEAILFSKTEQLSDALPILHQHAPLVIVTLGAQGALISQADGTQISIPAHTVLQVLDTNGAGDGFAGGFLFGLSQQMSLTDCGYLASAVAAAVVGQYGPRLPRQQYADLLAHTQPLSSV